MNIYIYIYIFKNFVKRRQKNEKKCTVQKYVFYTLYVHVYNISNQAKRKCIQDAQVLYNTSAVCIIQLQHTTDMITKTRMTIQTCVLIREVTPLAAYSRQGMPLRHHSGP